MNAHEAALLAWHLDTQTLMPHHHHLWPKEKPTLGETLDPQFFVGTYAKLSGAAAVLIPTVGGGFTLNVAGATPVLQFSCKA